MENFRFKDVPALNASALPFIANEKYLTEWFNSLSVFPNEIAAEKILHVTQAIGRIVGKTDSQLRLLQNILQNFHVMVEVLQKSYLDAGQPLDERATQAVELVVWNYMQLARVMLAIVHQQELKLTKEQQVLALYLSLEALNHAQLHIALSYRSPMVGFWALCYEVYRYAEHAGLLTLEVKRQGHYSAYSAEDESASIEKSFKQLLVFYLADNQQFRPRDMLAVFHYLAVFSMKAGILSDYQPDWQQGVCVFNLNQDLPPQRIFDAATRDEPLERFVAPIAVAKSMYEALQQKSDSTLHMINYEVMLRAINSLGLGRKRKFNRIPHHSEYAGILGLKALISHMQSKVTLNIDAYNTVQQLNQPKILGVWQKHEFDLVPAGDEVLHQMHQTYKHEIQQNTPLGKLLKVGSDKAENRQSLQFSQPVTQSDKVENHLDTFEVQDSSAKGYGLLTALSNINVKIGDVLGLIKEDSLNVELGLIRRINQMPAQRLRLGIEMLGFESELVFVYSRAQPAGNMWAMFLPGVDTLKQPDSIVYSSSLLKTGEIVSILRQDRERQYRLRKILQATSAVVHMELLLLSDE